MAATSEAMPTPTPHSRRRSRKDWLDLRHVFTAVATAVAVYVATAAVQRPAVTQEKIQDHDKRLAVLESNMTSMRDDIKAIRQAVEFHNR
jgi:cell division protein FtsB